MENVGLTGIIREPYVRILHVNKKLGSIVGPVISNGRLSFEDAEVIRSALPYFTENQPQHVACLQYGHPGGTQG